MYAHKLTHSFSQMQSQIADAYDAAKSAALGALYTSNAKLEDLSRCESGAKYEHESFKEMYEKEQWCMWDMERKRQGNKTWTQKWHDEAFGRVYDLQHKMEVAKCKMNQISEQMCDIKMDIRRLAKYISALNGFFEAFKIVDFYCAKSVADFLDFNDALQETGLFVKLTSTLNGFIGDSVREQLMMAVADKSSRDKQRDLLMTCVGVYQKCPSPSFPEALLNSVMDSVLNWVELSYAEYNEFLQLSIRSRFVLTYEQAIALMQKYGYVTKRIHQSVLREDIRLRFARYGPAWYAQCARWCKLLLPVCDLNEFARDQAKWFAQECVGDVIDALDYHNYECMPAELVDMWKYGWKLCVKFDEPFVDKVVDGGHCSDTIKTQLRMEAARALEADVEPGVGTEESCVESVKQYLAASENDRVMLHRKFIVHIHRCKCSGCEDTGAELQELKTMVDCCEKGRGEWYLLERIKV